MLERPHYTIGNQMMPNKQPNNTGNSPVLVDDCRFFLGVARLGVNALSVQGSGRKETRAMKTTPAMKSTVVKRSIVIAGHKTSVSLEDAFWNELKAIASERGMNLSELVASIDSERK